MPVLECYSLTEELITLSYYGRGPENYQDRNTSALKGIYESKVADQYVPYTRLKKMGIKNRYSLITLTNSSGNGIEIQGFATTEVSALNTTLKIWIRLN
jgi:beta-galactosidase